ncbi:MAG: alpha-amylase [Bacteroidales bacterium]|nr:alpha-amylase [Bacteroidales bacterium]MCI5619579.1 alpha-amylase family glycosyl hydrolase [Rikenellaceae bacterium]
MRTKTLIATAAGILLSAAASAQVNHHASWLKDAVVYQIYPSSFQDSDGNGIGDIPGIISRLDYIKSIGVSAIWMNPVFVSGFTDGGYDVIDFYKIDPRFGTNSDLVELVNQAHARGMKVILDLVAGHSSDQCEWFKQSKEADPNLRYSDYYIWPSFKPEIKNEQNLAGKTDYAQLMNSMNNIVNKFVASDAPRGPYYVKNFFDTQPALNFGFANPDPEHPWEQAVDAPGPMAMRRELKNIISFWMDKGVDGFRVDMAASLVKNDFDKSATIKLWKEDLSKWFKETYPEGLLIAEWFNPEQSIEAGFDVDFFAHDGKYNFSTLFFNTDRQGKSQPCWFELEGRGELKTWYDLYSYQYNAVKGKGYASLPTSNHDFNRPAAAARTTLEQEKVYMTFFLTMPGVPFIYYGDEIGLKQQFGLPSVEGSMMRSGTRIPMLWDSSDNAGFSSAPIEKLYIPQDPDPNRNTVEKSENDPNSLLNYTRTLIQLRKDNPVIGADADWRLVNGLETPYPMVYERTLGSEKCIIVLNPTAKKVTTQIEFQGKTPEIIGGSYTKASYKSNAKKGIDTITLSPVSAIIYKY